MLYPIILQVFIKGGEPVNYSFGRKFDNAVCHGLYKSVVMTCQQHNSLKVCTTFVKRLNTFQIEVVSRLVQRIITLGFCNIIRLIIQRTFSPPLSTFVFFIISSPVNNILPRKPLKRGSSRQ